MRRRCASPETLEINLAVEGVDIYDYIKPCAHEFVNEVVAQNRKFQIRNVLASKIKFYLDRLEINNSYKQEKLNEFTKHVVSFKELTPQFLPIELPPMKKLKLEYGQHWHSFLSEMEHSLFDLKWLKWHSLKELELSIADYSLSANF